jgi:LPS sulfotransferase NodH
MWRKLKIVLAELSYLFRSVHKQPRFVLFCGGRSGSTLLADLLNQLPDIHCDDEIFAQPFVKPYLHLKRRALWHHKKGYGFKLLMFQLRKIEKKDKNKVFRWLHRNGYKIIYLERQNLLEQAVSNVRARQFGFHQRKNDQAKFESAPIDKDELMHWLKGVDAQSRIEKELLQGYPFHYVSYEEGLEQESCHQQTIDRICAFLGINRAPVEASYKKVVAGSLEDIISNFGEIRDMLKETPYAKYLPS